MSDASWYWADGNNQIGPISVEQLRQLANSGQLGGETLVWNEGMPNWAQAQSVPGLLPAAAVAVSTNPVGGLEPIGAAPAMYPAGAQAVGYAAAASMVSGTHLNYYSREAGNVEYAGFWLRFVAYIIDYIITFVGAVLLGAIVGFVIGATMAASGNNAGIATTARAAGNILGIIVGWLYFALMESSPQQATLGKMALGLKVTDDAGQRLGFGRATGRYFAKILSGCSIIGFPMAGFTERKQALHDMIASTLVIRK